MLNYRAISNNLKKFVSSLKNKESREQNNLFVVEGEKLCKELALSNSNVELVVLSSKASEEDKQIANLFNIKGIPIYIARHQQFEQMCDTKSPQTILAVAQIFDRKISDQIPIIALESISDPGNLGTIIRTADWFGINNIVIGGDSVDKYNPKVIRSTMGSFLRCNIQHESDLCSFLSSRIDKYEIYGAYPTGNIKLENCKPQKKFIIVFGNEAKGISYELSTLIKNKYRIEGKGEAESLNLAISVGISLYHFSKYIN